MWRLSCLVIVLWGCSPYAMHYRSNALTSSTLLAERLQILDDRFAGADLCEDFRLARELILSLENSAKLPTLSQDCPTNFREFASAIQHEITSLHDLHSQVLFGNGIDVQLLPIIKSCAGSANCRKLVGSAVYPIASDAEDGFFAASFTGEKTMIPWQLLAIDGKKPLSFKAAMDKDTFYSHSKTNWASQLSAYILRRNTLAEQIPEIHLKLHDLSTKQDVEIQASYEMTQTVFGSKDILDVVQNMAYDRAYGCKDVMAGSSVAAGACRDQTGQSIVWIIEWPAMEAFKAWSESLAAWLSADDKTVKLDLRGNSGGNPVAVLQFLCEFGDAKSLDVVDAQSLDIRYWPTSFEVPGATFHEKDLEVFDNLPLIKVDPDFAMSAKAKTGRTYSMTMWERAGFDRSNCEGQRREALASTHWDILTNGNEFSAAEDFLFVAHEAKDKFTLYGQTTVGGSGNPSWITLPHTKAGVRLSPSRTIYNGQVAIEGKGVAPDVTIKKQETAREFGVRFVTMSQAASLIDFSQDRRSAQLRKSFFNRPGDGAQAE